MRVLFVIATACLAVGAGKKYNFVSVKYDFGPRGFYSLPRKPEDNTRYHFVANDKDLNVDLYSYYNDPRFFILYDHYGNIAGIRIGYIKADLTKRADKNKVEFPYRLDDKKMFESGNYWDTDIWHSTVLFVDPDVLKKGGRERPKRVVAEDIYLKLEGKWTKIPTDQCEAGTLGFTKQGCFPGMGRHYFYKMSETADCKDIQGIFLLYESGQLVGLGLITFGTSSSGPGRTWFEDPPSSVVKTIVPNRPTCLTEWVKKYGASSIHIFFKAVPRLTSCLYPFQRRNQCPKESKSLYSGWKPKTKDFQAETPEDDIQLIETLIPTA